jgi:hypothetical protein
MTKVLRESLYEKKKQEQYRERRIRSFGWMIGVLLFPLFCTYVCLSLLHFLPPIEILKQKWMFSLRKKKAYNDKLFGRVTNQRLQVSLLVVATIPDGNDFTERY